MLHRLSPLRPIRTTAGIAILFLATATGTAGCGGTHTGAFRDADGQSNCQVHQDASPSKAYTGGTEADTLAILPMMHYYTAHASQPYCDGRPASTLDKTWSALYTRLSGG